MTPPAENEAPPEPGDTTDGADGAAATRSEGGTDSGASTDPSAEAARYRRRLRETESERDGLAGRLERAQRAEVERLASERLAVAADVWTFGAELAELTGDDGDVDADQVAALVERITAERPGLAIPAARVGVGGQGSRGEPLDTQTTPTWAEVLRGKR